MLDPKGRHRVPFYAPLIREWVAHGNVYDGHADEFKNYVEGLGVLTKQDYDLEANGYPKWKHRIDRAAQKVFTNI